MAVKQRVFLEVWDAPTGGTLVLKSNDLRVDFDIRHIPEFSRATFTIWNLNDETIRNLMGPNRYVTLRTQLQDNEVQLLANRFYINNAVDELNLPNRVTKLYCFDRLRNTFLEKQISIPVHNHPSLKDLISGIAHTIGYPSIRDTDFKSFPVGLIYQPSKKVTRMLNGSAQLCLSRLEREYKFVTYTTDGRLEFMHTPTTDTLKKTPLADRKPDIILHTRSMRSNPKIGIATCTIHNNLDGRIKPTHILDLSQLLVAAVDADEDTLQLVENFLRNFKENSMYQAFAVSHSGSNYTADWSTRITGLSPSRGTLMPTINWAGQVH